VLAYLRKGGTFAELAAGFRVDVTTAWRYVEETVALLAARAEAPPGAAKRRGPSTPTSSSMATLIPIDRVAADRPFYSGKHKKHGMNLQVIASPDGDILRVSGALPGSVHDKNAERVWGILAELEAAGLVTLADKGYQGSARQDPVPRGKTSPNPGSRPVRPTRNCGHPASARTPSSRPSISSASSAAAPGASATSPGAYTYCRSARHNQDGMGSLLEEAILERLFWVIRHGMGPGPNTSCFFFLI